MDLLRAVVGGDLRQTQVRWGGRRRVGPEPVRFDLHTVWAVDQPVPVGTPGRVERVPGGLVVDRGRRASAVAAFGAAGRPSSFQLDRLGRPARPEGRMCRRGWTRCGPWRRQGRRIAKLARRRPNGRTCVDMSHSGGALGFGVRGALLAALGRALQAVRTTAMSVGPTPTTSSQPTSKPQDLTEPSTHRPILRNRQRLHSPVKASTGGFQVPGRSADQGHPSGPRVENRQGPGVFLGGPRTALATSLTNGSRPPP